MHEYFTVLSVVHSGFIMRSPSRQFEKGCSERTIANI